MRIDINSIDLNQFMVLPHVFSGEEVVLVQPLRLGCQWTQDNKHFRSSVWTKEGELVSAGLPKFTNWGENPEVFPVPSSLKNASVLEKLDGSSLIVSRYNGQFMVRTRGTIDASKLENGFELNEFQPILDKLVRFFNKETWDFSLVFEWLSPVNVIVIRHEKLAFKLIAQVRHFDYSLASQKELDFLADTVGLDRPETFSFNNIVELLEGVSKWNDKEGVCVYSSNGQIIHKIKAETYLKLHRFKSQATFENTVDLFFEYGMPDYVTFKEQLINHFDFECFNMVQGFLSEIVDGYKEVNKIVVGMKNFIKNELSKYPTRKLQAVVVFQSYGKDSNRASYVFRLLDGKDLSKDDLKKLLFQVTKK